MKSNFSGLSAVFLLVVFVFPVTSCFGLPAGFVYVEEVIPNIKFELRYCTDNNFIGRPIDGYVRPRCILTKEAALALKKVQAELNRSGLGLKIYDAYRPQRAVYDFVRWARDINDTRMKGLYYPDVDKRELFDKGYISKNSAHSRGSTVDVTIVSLEGLSDDDEIDMGSKFDFFGPISWLNSKAITPTQRTHRLLLQVIMSKHGFRGYRKEWWHFTLRKEPYANTYFDFPVE
jgi:zinc D-Ala-D-Ala dipeptidase